MRAVKSSRFAIIVRLHIRTEAKEDQAKNLRAIAAECLRSGFHVYFLHQVRSCGHAA